MRALSIFVFILISLVLSDAHSQIHQDAKTKITQERTASEYQPSQEASAPLEPIELRLIGKKRLPIDLPTALRLATASNLEIAEAKAQVLEAKGNSDAADGGLIPGVSLF